MNEKTGALFLVGSGRSGTTALYRHICANFDVGYITAFGARYPRTLWPAAVASRHLSHKGLKPSAESRVLFERHGLGHDEIQRLGRPIVASDCAEDMALSFRRTLSRVARLQAKSVVVVKNTSATTRLNAISWMAPEAKFLHLVRDGRAVAASLSRVEFFPSLRIWWADGRTATELVPKYGSLALVGAEHWSRQVTAALSALAELPPERYRTIRYGDFVGEPEKALKSVGELFPELQRRASPSRTVLVNSGSIERWKSDLTPTEISAVSERYGDLLRSIGSEDL